MEPLEQREIRGITAKQLIWFFGGIISVIMTVVIAYYKEKEIIGKLQDRVEIITSDIKVLQNNQKEAEAIQRGHITELAIINEKLKDKNNGKRP